MPRYRYEDLSEDQFESLARAICRRLFGQGFNGFSKGKDGGRDGKFVGTAECFPSRSRPWSGTTIIQAKHTNKYHARFSSTDFFSPDSSSAILSQEVPRIKRLRESGELDFYLLIANRKLAANQQEKIVAYLSSACNLPKAHIFLAGIETLEDWLYDFPGAAKSARLDFVDSPLKVESSELAEVVSHIADHLGQIPSSGFKGVSKRISFEQKNQINNMSMEYASELRNRVLKDTPQFDAFFANPINEKITSLYELAADEFKIKILSKRKNYQSFDEVLEYLIDLLLDRDTLLKKHKRLTRTLIFYMYWNCDIGVDDASPDQTLSP